jgi:hypothetical protein
MSITALQIVTPPATLPVSLTEAKRHLRVSSSAEDAHINDLLKGAIAWAERESRRRLISQTVTLSMDRFPRRGEFVFAFGHNFENLHFGDARDFGREFDPRARDRFMFLPGGVTTAVDEIRYTDESGAPQTLTGPTSGTPGADYQEDLSDDEGAFVMPSDAAEWPATDLGVVNAVVIQFQVGYSDDPAQVPDDIKAAIKFRIGDLFNIRDSSTKNPIGDTASNLLEQHRIQMF